jgi:integrase
MSKTREEQLVLEGTAYDNFINAVRSKSSQKFYLVGLKKFMAYNGIQKVSDMIVWDQRLIEAKIISWLVNMRDKESLTYITIQSYLSAVMTFYKMNDIEPRRHKINCYLPEERKLNDDRAYTHKEIGQLLQFCDQRMKALILMLASSGMRIGAVPDLKIKHLTKIQKYNLYKIKVYAGYPKWEHFTFTTPEAANSMDAYFDYRQRYGEKINPDSPVIREQFDITDILSVKQPKKLTAKYFGDMLNETLQRAGIFAVVHMTEGQKVGRIRNAVPRAHGFRKFFETNLIRAKVLDPIPELLLGHDIGLKKHSLRLGEDEILEEYIKAVDALTINEENRLKRKVAELTIRTDRLDALTAQMERLNKKLGLE